MSEEGELLVRRCLSRLACIVERSSAAVRRRDPALVRDRRAEISQRLQVGFDSPSKLVETAKAYELLRVHELCRIKSPPQHAERFVIGL